jgi:uncharacterized membrane protein YtjA (UPF0391 family)
MNKLISLALLVGGIVLIIYGAAASDSLSSSFSRFFTGNPTDKTMWLLIGGIVAAVAGLFGVLRDSKHNSISTTMLNYAVTFLIIALIAGILGFGVIAGTAATIAKVLFVIFLVLFIASFFRGSRTG